MLAFLIRYPVSASPALSSSNSCPFGLLWTDGDRWQRAVQCDGLGTDDETTLTLSVFIHQPLPSTQSLSAWSHYRYSTLYESVASIMLKSASLCSIFNPSVVSLSQLSVLCLPALLLGTPAWWCSSAGGRTSVENKAGEGAGGLTSHKLRQNSAIFGCTQSANPI